MQEIQHSASSMFEDGHLVRTDPPDTEFLDPKIPRLQRLTDKAGAPLAQSYAILPSKI